MAKSNPHFDVCIVGGAMVGLTAAALLAQSDLSIAVVEHAKAPKARKTKEKPDYDLRVSAVNLASMRIFEHLQIAESILQTRASPYRAMQIWDKNSDANIDFSSQYLEVDQLGYILENSLIINCLTKILKANNNVTFFYDNELTALDNHADGIDLQLKNKNLSCKLLIGADGQYSKVRGLAQLQTDSAIFDQTALVCRIETELPHHQTAYQCFHHTGPIAYLPLADGSCSIVWSCDTQYARELKAIDDANFANAVEEAMQSKLGKVEIVSPRVGFDLAQQHAKQYFGSRIALIGDAAHRTHPLAGLGANLGLQDAAMLAEVVIKAHKQNRPFYSQRTLRAYERSRKYQNTLVLDAMAAFKTGFASRSSGITALRSFALNSVDQIAPLKMLISHLATGLNGDLPQICKSNL